MMNYQPIISSVSIPPSTKSRIARVCRIQASEIAAALITAPSATRGRPPRGRGSRGRRRGGRRGAITTSRFDDYSGPRLVSSDPRLPEPEFLSPLVKAAAHLNKLLDNQDIESCIQRCQNLIEDAGAFVGVCFSLRSLQTKENRHVMGLLLVEMLRRSLITADDIYIGLNQGLISRSAHIMWRIFGEILTPLVLSGIDGVSGGELLTCASHLSVKQLERMNESIVTRLAELVGSRRVEEYMPDSAAWDNYLSHKQHQDSGRYVARERFDDKRLSGHNSKHVIRCRESGCRFTGTSVKSLRHHMQLSHDIVLSETRNRFPSVEDFLQWKSDVEAQAGVEFVYERGSEKGTHYRCPWTARVTSGSMTTGVYVCPAGLSFRIVGSGEVDVVAVLQHQHSSDMSQVLQNGDISDLPADDQTIGTTANGTSVPGALGGASSVGGVASTQFTQSQDFNDVVFMENTALAPHTGQGGRPADAERRKYTEGVVPGVQKPAASSAATRENSLNQIVAEIRRANSRYHDATTYGNMNVVLYKERHVPDAEESAWQLDDFALSLSSDRQLEMLSTHGGSVLCVCSAMEDPNAIIVNELKLIAISIVDENLEAWPVVWLLTNRWDELASSELIKHVGWLLDEKSLAFRAPVVFLCDSAEAYRGWCEVTDTQPQLMLCPWHVHGAWYKSIGSLVQNAEKAAELRQRLLALVRPYSEPVEKETQTRELEALITQAQADTETARFAEHFTEHWMTCTDQWLNSSLAEIIQHPNLFVKALIRVVRDLGNRDFSSCEGCVEELLVYLEDRIYDVLCRNSEADQAMQANLASAVSPGGATALPMLLQTQEAELISQAHSDAIVDLVSATITPLDHAYNDFDLSLAAEAWLVAGATVVKETEMAEVDRPMNELNISNSSWLVERWIHGCPMEACTISCSQCGGACVHEYTCTCPQSTPLCRHIHMVVQHQLRQQQHSYINKHDNVAIATISGDVASGHDIVQSVDIVNAGRDEFIDGVSIAESVNVVHADSEKIIDGGSVVESIEIVNNDGGEFIDGGSVVESVEIVNAAKEEYIDGIDVAGSVDIVNTDSGEFIDGGDVGAFSGNNAASVVTTMSAGDSSVEQKVANSLLALSEDTDVVMETD